MKLNAAGQIGLQLKQRAEMERSASIQARLSLVAAQQDLQRVSEQAVALGVPPGSLAMLAIQYGHLCAVKAIASGVLEALKQGNAAHADIAIRLEAQLGRDVRVGSAAGSGLVVGNSRPEEPTNNPLDNTEEPS